MDLKARFRNKTTLLALITCISAFIYQLSGMIGFTVPISEDASIQIIGIILNLLVGLGVVVDPTTKGIGDGK